MPDLEHMLMDRIRILEALYLVDRIREAHPAQTQDLTTISLSTIDPTQPPNRALIIKLAERKATLLEANATDQKKLAEVSVPSIRALISVLEINVGENYSGSKFIRQI